MDKQPNQREDPPGGTRRSSRSNIGIPPNRFGDWITTLPASLFASTAIAGASGTQGTVLPGGIKVLEDDKMSTVSRGSARSRASKHDTYLDQEIKKLEESVHSKINTLLMLKSIRDGADNEGGPDDQTESDDDPEVINHFKISNPNPVKDEEEGAVGGAGANKRETTKDVFGEAKQLDQFGFYDDWDDFMKQEIVTPIPNTGKPKFYPTPKPRTRVLSKPSLAQDDPVFQPRVGSGNPNIIPIAKTRVPPYLPLGPKQKDTQPSPIPVPKLRTVGTGGNVYPRNPSTSGARPGGIGNPYHGGTGGPRQPQNPSQGNTGVDALANALAQALQFQNQNTERFVARQSTSSKLPTFGGNPLDWPLFSHHYEQSTWDCGFTPAQNMSRLEKALKGEARATVKALMIIPHNADVVMDRLRQRYGRPEYIVRALVDLAKKTPSPKEGKIANILDYANSVCNLVSTINSIGVPVHLENPQLLQELVEKLPDTLKLQWGSYSIAQGGGNLEDFSNWVLEIAEAASVVSTPKFSFKEKKEESNYSAEEVATEENKPSSSATRPCLGCKTEGHNLWACEAFKKLNTQERWELVKKNNLCYRCLKGGHSIKTCRSRYSCRVEGCSRRHHTLLHGNPPGESDSGKSDKAKKSEDKKKPEELNASVAGTGGSSLLRIVVVTLYGPKGEQTVNALLDEGSTVTLISNQLAEELGLQGTVDPLRIKWTDGRTQEDKASRKVECWIGPAGQRQKYKMKKVRTVKNMCLPKQRDDLKEVVKMYPHLQTKIIKYLPGERPMILLGQQHIHLSVAREIIEKDEESPMITNTKLGWVLHGPASGDSSSESNFLCHAESDDEILHNLVKETFALESIGIRTTYSTRSKEDVEAEDSMAKITKRIEDGSRFETGLLWRSPDVKLPNSRDVALIRYFGIEKKLKKNPKLAEQYRQKIEHYMKTGYARKLTKEELQVPTNKEWYLPHFNTTHPNKPGKIRIVFDAASRAKGVSLNDFLLVGPDLLVSLPGLLVKFRQRKIAVGGDITEMFHQIKIRKEDCPAQRFLWKENEEDKEPSTYQLEVMMFGSVCSPFCAQYVKNINATEHKSEFPEATEAIVKYHYMDDWIQSLNSEEEAIKLALQVKDVHSRGGFEIGKWTSNSLKFLQAMKVDVATDPSKDLAEWSEVQTERALGLHWIPAEDKFTYRVNLERAGAGVATGEVVPTKRMILRLVMLVWDPLGFLGHYLIKARILLQDLWKKKIGWDDCVTNQQFRKWKAWIADLPKLTGVRIRRCYSDFASSSPDVQLHIFADSSEQASCGIAYLRVQEENGEITVSLVLAKTRVAPVKPCSVPRLELTAALIAARMGKFLLSQLEIKIHSVTYWTDSMTTLRWIRSEARKFQQFVAVRVGEIQELTNTDQWKWVPSAENPADDATRNGKTDLGENSRWWNGPNFLRGPVEEFPKEATPKLEILEEEDAPELRREFVAVIEGLSGSSCLPEASRFQSYTRLLRSTAVVLAFINKLQKKPGSLNLSLANKLLIRRSQWNSFPEEMQVLTEGGTVHTRSRLFELSPMLDDEGILRMNSRLVTASQEGIRQPYILHPKDEFTVLLLQHYHKSFLHGGEDLIRNEVRQKFWIPNIRSAVRKVIRNCNVCKKRRVQAVPPMMGALPDVKIQPQPRPFYVTGMDYFGPMDVTIGRRREKRYGVLFTCMNTRAVHLEIAASLTTDSCIMAIRRMIGRRGQPAQIFSDNGTNLRGAEKELRMALDELDQERMLGELQVKGIEWHFIPPSAAHMGGSWERLVRSVKVAMKTILNEQAPKEEVLHTIMIEAEACVNSRPLTDIPVDPESPEALTPFHFLIGSSSVEPPPGNFETKRLCTEKQWRQSQALADSFWKRWVREYLPTLQRRAKWHHDQPSLEIGDIVVVFDASLRRNNWPLGKIINVFPGKDGIVRVAEVKTSTGIYKRPVVKLGKLDVKISDDKTMD